MTKNLSIIFLLFIICILSACNKEININKNNDTIINLEIAPNKNNALRQKVTFTTVSKTSCKIEYWKSDNLNCKQSSAISPIDIEHTITLLFLEPNTNYSFKILTTDNKQICDSIYSFKTKALEEEIDNFVKKVITNEYDFDGYLLYSSKTLDYHVMINSNMKPVWYENFYPLPSSSARYNSKTEELSFMYGKAEERFCSTDIAAVDLYGNLVMHNSKENLPYPLLHHDIYQLSNGNWAYINFIDKEYDFSPLGVDSLYNVRGDGITEIDRDGKVVWQWNAFDHSSPLDDPEILNANGPFGSLSVRGDWMHANSIAEDINGDIYVSFNRLEQFWKIDKESGEVIYKLGRGGDIKLSEEAIPSFIHSLSLLDNGDIMFYENGTSKRGYSRVLAYRVNEEDKTAELVKNIKLPASLTSFFQSSVYMIDNSHILVHSSNKNNTAILDCNGKIVWQIEVGDNSFRAQYIPKISL